MNKTHTKSLCNKMPRLIKNIYYTIVLFGNVVINKIPSRHVRKWYYQLMGAEIGKDTFPCRRVEVLLPKGLKLADGVAVGWFAELDARGGITVDHDTNISSHCKLITGSHDIDDPEFTADFKPDSHRASLLVRNRCHRSSGSYDWRWCCCGSRGSCHKGYSFPMKSGGYLLNA